MLLSTCHKSVSIFFSVLHRIDHFYPKLTIFPRFGQVLIESLEQYPIEDEEMEIEEGVAVTEQVVNLLDQMIKQGKELKLGNLTGHSATGEDTLNMEEDGDCFVGYGTDISISLVLV